MLVFWLCLVHCSSVSSGISGCNEESRIACRIYRPTPRATGGAVCRTMGRSLVRSVVVVVQRVARSRDIWRYKTHMSCDLVASSFNRCSRCTTVAPGNMKIIARLRLTTVVSWCSGRSPLVRFYILLATQRQHFYNRTEKIFSKKKIIARVRRQL